MEYLPYLLPLDRGEQIFLGANLFGSIHRTGLVNPINTVKGVPLSIKIGVPDGSLFFQSKEAT